MGSFLEDLFFQLQSDSLRYDELVNWNPNEESVYNEVNEIDKVV